jgi:EAL domain-containing protein (putative c-di-GMP-specific phosphodiesterase class I)
MDDFGTGYSSLLYLKDLPINVLKIDISFVRDIAKGHKEKALIKTIIGLSKELGLKTIAEGVETQEQFDILKSLGCCYVQGFLLAKPMPEEEAFKIIK